MTMMFTTYLASLSPLALLRSLPGACAQGLIWGLLALGVYITYKLLDFADLTVDGSMATGGAVAVMLLRAGMNPWLALILQEWPPDLSPECYIPHLGSRESLQVS